MANDPVLVYGQNTEQIGYDMMEPLEPDLVIRWREAALGAFWFEGVVHFLQAFEIRCFISPDLVQTSSFVTDLGRQTLKRQLFFWGTTHLTMGPQSRYEVTRFSLL